MDSFQQRIKMYFDGGALAQNMLPLVKKLGPKMSGTLSEIRCPRSPPPHSYAMHSLPSILHARHAASEGCMWYKTVAGGGGGFSGF